MTGDERLFNNITYKSGGNDIYGDNSKGKILGIGTIYFPNLTLENVFLIEGLKHNLISISQLCDKDHQVCFDSNSCEVTSLK